MKRDSIRKLNNKNHRLIIRSTLFIGVTLLMLSLLLVGCNKEQQQSNSKQQLTAAQRNVRVVPVVRKDITAGISTTGRIQSDIYVNVSPIVSGKIRKIYVKEGDSVNEGDMLLEIDDTQLIQAEQSFKNIEKNYERLKELLKTDAIDQKSFEEVEMGYILSKSGYELALENTKIKAPIKGKVASITLKEGETYTPMMQPHLIRLLSSEQMKVMTTISDKEYPLLKLNTRAQVKVDAYPDKVFDGKVTFISPEADQLSGTFRCEIKIDDRGNQLRNNQFARVYIVTNEKKNTLVIPSEALLNNRLLFVADNGFARQRDVTVGITTPSEIEVLAGIKENELAIVTGSIGLTDGFLVNIIE